MEEMFELERHPDFDLEGRFIAEFDGKPVGTVHAHVEKLDGGDSGFLQDFCVLPAYRGLGVEEGLLKAAVSAFKRRRVSIVRAWTEVNRTDRIQFLEKTGFRFENRTLDIRISLTDIPSKLGENTEVAIRPVRVEMEADIKALNWLSNECFHDNPLHHPQTVEETRQSLLNNPVFKQQEFFFAMLDNNNAGYIGVGIDEKYNVEYNVKSGVINEIGVLPAYRRKGIGTRLILHGLKTLKARGMTSATLDTEDNNPTRAVTLYEKVGFQVLQEYGTYKKDITRG